MKQGKQIGTSFLLRTRYPILDSKAGVKLECSGLGYGANGLKSFGNL